MTTVRPARLDDADFIAATLRERHSENEVTRDLPVTEVLLRRTAMTILERYSIIVGIAEDSNGQRVGAIMGQITNYLGTDVPFVADVSLSVEPEARGGTAAVRLMEFLHEKADALGCHSVCLVNALGHDNHAIDRLAQHFGYTSRGTFYRRQ